MKNWNEMSDIELSYEYRKSGDEKCFQTMVTRYERAIHREAKKMQEKTAVFNLGMEYNDYVCLAVEQLAKALKWWPSAIERAKKKQKTEFDESKMKFVIPFQSYCHSFVVNTRNKYCNSKRRRGENFTEYRGEYLSSEMIHMSVEDSSKELEEKEFVQSMFEGLTELQKDVLTDLMNGVSRSRIRSKYGTNFTKVFNELNLKFQYLKKSFV